MSSTLLAAGIRTAQIGTASRTLLALGTIPTAHGAHGAPGLWKSFILGASPSNGSMNYVMRSFAAQPEPRKQAGGHSAPVSMRTLILTMMLGAGVVTGVKTYSDQKMQTVMKNSQQVAGKASVGGPFDLIDADGKRFTDRELLGEFALLYFGFTHCPDICPDEMEKVAETVDIVEKQVGVKVPPVFISVDPQRDTPPLVKKYVAEFHPRMIGLTGDFESVKKCSKSYRVYFNKTGDSDTDYLVDHSIIHYLIDPEGEFVTFYGKNFTAEGIAESVVSNIVEWKKSHPSYHEGKEINAPHPPASAAK